MPTQPLSKDVQFITPPNIIKAKIGAGGLSIDVIQKAQTIIEKQAENYDAIAMPYLNKLEKSIKELQNATILEPKDLEKIAHPCVDLKSSSAMFKYDLVSMLSGQLIGFVEKAKTTDREILEIAQAFHTTLTTMIKGKMSGNGGQAGQTLATELAQVCKRYFEKKNA